jgi:uncharacterized membrane protein
LEGIMNFLIILLLCTLATTKVTLQSRFGKKGLKTNSDNILFNAIVFLTAAVLFCVDIPKASFNTWLFALSFAVLTVIFQLSYTKALSVGNVSLTVMAVNLSMRFPSLVSVIFYNESLSIMRTIGIVLTVLSFTLTVDIKDKEKLSRSWLIFTVVAALANGGIGITQKIFGMQTFSIEKKSFVACSYAIAFLVAIVIYLLTCSQKKENNNFKFTSNKTYIFAIAVGVILAVFQWLNTYAISIMDGSFLFPLYSGGSIILSTLVGILFFKDKLTKRQKYSITLGIIAVIIMNI